jgi:integrase
LNSGLRTSEVLRLRWEDIDLTWASARRGCNP